MGSSLSLTLMGLPHLACSLRSLVVRLCRISPALHSWSAWLWRSLLAFAARHRRTQTQVGLYANDVPGPSVPVGYGEDHASLRPGQAHLDWQSATPTPLLAVNWQKILSRLRERTADNTTDCTLLAATPEGGSQRYNARTATGLLTPDQFEVPIGQKTLLSSLPSLSEGSGWRRFVHPEGVVIFYHEEFRIFTEHDVRNSAEQEQIFACATRLVQRAIDATDVTLDDLTHIVLNVDDSGIWHYYFVDHTNRLLFWVDKVSARKINIDLQGIDGHNHIKYMIEAYYWYASSASLFERTHCEYYPHDRVLPTQAFEDLRGMLNYAKIDVLTTDSSSSPFGQDELAAMLGLLDSLKDVSEISDPYSIWAIARLMAYFTENQFLNFYGQTCARLNADHPLFGKVDWDRQYWLGFIDWFGIINVFLLASPNEHVLRLQRVWVDGIIIQPRWKDFINRLTTELARYTIFSTVMLAVNFSFLAVPGVVAPDSTARAIQIIIYCSIVSTIASIVFSFGLLNVYSNPRLLIAGNALNAMWKLSQFKMGMACLAITHSLPIASLIWSIIFFSVALVVQIFGATQLATVVTLSIEYAAIVVFGIMGAVVMWEFSRNDDGDGVLDTSAQKDARPPPDIEEGLARGHGPPRALTARSLTR